MKPIITRFDKNSGDILLSIPMFDKDIFHRIQQIEKDNPSWFDLEHYNIFDLIKENQKYKEVIDKISNTINSDINGFRTINEHGESTEILDLLEVYKDILKEVK